MKKIKSNRGVTMTDLIIAFIILMLFSGIVGNLIYKIAYNNAEIRMNALAVDYAIKIAEYTDKVGYDDVVSNDNITEINGEEVNDVFKIKMDVEKYNSVDETKKDIIKKVNIVVKYTLLNEEKQYELNKIKIKEM